MDGTKPAMDSNAEETQDEGQESKGTIVRLSLCVYIYLYVYIVFGDVCASASPAMAPRLVRDTKAVFFPPFSCDFSFI